MVRDKRLELLRLATRGPKPRLYANSSNPGYVSFGSANRTFVYPQFLLLRLVPLAGLEPARYCYQGIFLLLYVAIAG